MALPNSPSSISLNQVNVELGLAGTTTISMNQSTLRSLFGVASGQISMSQGFGKSNVTTPSITAITVTGTHSYSNSITASGVANNSLNQSSSSYGYYYSNNIDTGDLNGGSAGTAAINITATGGSLSYTWEYSGRRNPANNSTWNSYNPGYQSYPLTLSNGNYYITSVPGYGYYFPSITYVPISGSSSSSLSIGMLPIHQGNANSYYAGYWGANSAVLGSGWYRCRVQNSAGTTYSPWIPIGIQWGSYDCNCYCDNECNCGCTDNCCKIGRAHV